MSSEARFRIVPFHPSHLGALKLPVAIGEATALQRSGLNWTAVEGHQVIMSAGIVPSWPGRAQAWAYVGEVPRRRWPAITARVMRAIEDTHAAGYRRIEATVRDGFDAGHRWLQILGFERRCLLPVYDHEGYDHWLYDRVRA
jgi:hypothetical protein